MGVMDPHEYDALGIKAGQFNITPDELDRMNEESQRRVRVLTSYVDKELALKPLGPCGGCGYSEVGVNAIPAQMSVITYCAMCMQPRKIWSNIGEPESWQ